MDAVVNLVPYIDLLMTIMTFLVMTAVWTQLASLEIQNASGGQTQEEQEKDEDKPKPIFVIVTDGALKVQEEGAEMQEFPSTGEGYDYGGMEGALKALKEARPERVELKIQSEDGVKFEALTKVIDVATGLELTGLTLQPAGG